MLCICVGVCLGLPLCVCVYVCMFVLVCGSFRFRLPAMVSGAWPAWSLAAELSAAHTVLAGEAHAHSHTLTQKKTQHEPHTLLILILQRRNT